MIHTSKDERTNIVNDFRNNKFKILCNVNIFTEGFDCLDVDAVQLAGSTKSLALFLQQVGRCMRQHQSELHGLYKITDFYDCEVEFVNIWGDLGQGSVRKKYRNAICRYS